MTNDDSRGLESPDRPHASTPTDRVAYDGGTTDESIRERLETIARLTNSILEEVRNPDTTNDLEDLSDETRRGATRRLREIDAEARRVGLELFGPGMLIPSRSAEAVDDDRQTDELPTVVGCDSLTTTFRGPIRVPSSTRPAIANLPVWTNSSTERPGPTTPPTNQKTVIAMGSDSSPSSAPPEPLELEALRDQITTLEDRVAGLEMECSRKGDRIDSLEAECQHKDDRIAELERRLTECETRTTETDRAADAALKKADANKDRVRELQSRELEKGAHLRTETVDPHEIRVAGDRLEKLTRDDGRTYYRVPDSSDPWIEPTVSRSPTGTSSRSSSSRGWTRTCAARPRTPSHPTGRETLAGQNGPHDRRRPLDGRL